MDGKDNAETVENCDHINTATSLDCETCEKCGLELVGCDWCGELFERGNGEDGDRFCSTQCLHACAASGEDDNRTVNQTKRSPTLNESEQAAAACATIATLDASPSWTSAALIYAQAIANTKGKAREANIKSALAEFARLAAAYDQIPTKNRRAD